MPERGPSPIAERRASSFRAATALAFLSGMVIIVLMGVLSYRTTSALIENSSWISHTQNVIGNLDELMSRLERAESAQGRYIITGDDLFLHTFDEDIRSAYTIHDNLLRLTSDNHDQQQRLRELRRSIDYKVEHMRSTVQSRRADGMTPEIASRVASEGKRRMDDVQRRISELNTAETQLLVTRAANQRRSAEESLRSILIAGILALIFLALCRTRPTKGHQ